MNAAGESDWHSARLLLSSLRRVRDWFRSRHLMTWLIALFVGGFIVATTTRGHRDFLYFLVLLPFFLTLRLSDLRSVFSERVVQVALFFLVCLLISQAWGSMTDPELVYDRVRWALLAFLFVVVVALMASRDPNWPDKLACVLAVCVIAAFIYSVFSFYSQYDFPASRLANQLYYSNNPIRGSVGVALAGVVCAFQLMKGSAGRLGTLFWTGLLSAVSFLILGQSRGLALALFVSIVVGLILGRWWKLLGVFTLIAVLVVLATEVPDVGVRGFLGRADSYRLDIWLVTIERIKDVLLFGEGLNSSREISVSMYDKTFHSPHNIFLVTGVTGGLVGIALLLLLYAVTIRAAITVGVRANQWLPLGLIVFGVVTMSLAAHEVIYRVEPHVWLGLWLPIGLASGAYLGCILPGKIGRGQHLGFSSGRGVQTVDWRE